MPYPVQGDWQCGAPLACSTVFHPVLWFVDVNMIVLLCWSQPAMFSRSFCPALWWHVSDMKLRPGLVNGLACNSLLSYAWEAFVQQAVRVQLKHGSTAVVATNAVEVKTNVAGWGCITTGASARLVIAAMLQTG